MWIWSKSQICTPNPNLTNKSKSKSKSQGFDAKSKLYLGFFTPLHILQVFIYTNNLQNQPSKLLLLSEIQKFSLFPIRKKVQKSVNRKIKLEYLHYGSSKRADSFVNNTTMFKVYIHKDMPSETLC